MICLVTSAFYYYSLKIGIIFKAFKSKGEILKRSVKYLIFFMAAFFICAPTQRALASAEVYIGVNTYSPSVKRWAVSIDSAPFNSVSWIWNLDIEDKLHRNGRRDTILVVPETAIPEDITLVVWFHGLIWAGLMWVGGSDNLVGRVMVYVRRVSRRQTSSTFSRVLNEEMRKYPSPAAPNPAPGVMTTWASSSILSNMSQESIPSGHWTQT